MNDLELLLIVLVAFYVWECANWIRRPGIVFRSWFGPFRRAVLPVGALSNRIGGFLLASPLPGAGAFFAVQWPPVVFTSDAIIAHRDPLDLRNDLPPRAGESLAYDQIEKVEARRHQVWINGKRFAAAGSPSGARSLARLIKELKAGEPEKRAARISDWLRSSLDKKRVSERVELWRQGTAWLGSFCLVEFSIVLAFCVWLVRDLSLREVWPWFAGGLVFTNVVATISFCRAHRRLFPDAFDERVQHTAMMAVFPLATIRAVDVVSRPLLEDLHPLAVGSLFMRPEEFSDFARRQLRRARVWAAAAPNETRPFYQLLTDAMVKFLRGAGVDPEELLKPPPAGDPVCRSFCPRCGSQFTFASGQCGDCGTIPVEPVAGA